MLHVIPAPAPAILSLHNELVELDFEDVDGARRLAWNIRKLVKEKPSDFGVRLTYGIAAQRLGDRATAVSEVSAAFGLRHRAEQGLAELGILALQVGEFGVSEKLYAEYRSRGPIQLAGADLEYCLLHSLIFALFTDLPKLPKNENGLDGPTIAASLTSVGLHDTWGIYTDVMRAVFGPHMLNFKFAMDYDTVGAEAFVTFTLDLPYGKRRELKRRYDTQISETLRASGREELCQDRVSVAVISSLALTSAA